MTARAESGLSVTDPLVFTASLCTKHDNLNLWRFYGAAKGVSFGVHSSQFDLDSEEGISDTYKGNRDKLYRVKYGDDAVEEGLKHLRPALKRLGNIYVDTKFGDLKPFIAKATNDLLGTVAYLFKTNSYEAEMECRIIRIQSISEARAGPFKAIGGVVRIESNVEFIHAHPPPIVTLGPQFDVNNPERGQTKVMDRISVSLGARKPIVKLSTMKYRGPDPPHPVGTIT